MKDNLTIVLICHFTNNEIQDILLPSKRINELASWIPQVIKLFENGNSKCNLHVISPHEYINKNKSFILRGVYYNFYNAHMPVIGRHWPNILKFDYWTNFYHNKKIVSKIVTKIKPDIIHLFGAENAYYSSTILQFKNKYPVLISLQGFVSKNSGKKNNLLKKRSAVEKEILTHFTNFAAHTDTLKKEIESLNTNAYVSRLNYPIPKYPPIPSKKRIDIVFFARITQDKGIKDLIEALAIIKKKKKEISLYIIGPGNMEPMKKYAERQNISENIKWVGFLPSKNEVHLLASQAKVSVLPTYHDIISGTIIESMFLKLPVVAYDVGSIHEVNEKEEVITLVKKNDIKLLASKIMFLLDHPKACEAKAEKAYARACEMFVHTSENLKIGLLNAYSEAINLFEDRS